MNATTENNKRQIGFVVPVSEKNNPLENIAKQVMDAIGKIKDEATFVFLFKDADIVSKLQQYQALKPYLQNQTIVLQSCQKKNRFSSSIMDNSLFSELCILPFEQMDDAANIANWYAQNKAKIEKNTVYSIQTKGKTSKSIAAGIAGLALPIKTAMLKSNVFLFNTETAKSIIPQLSTISKKYRFQIPFVAKHQQVKTEVLEIKNLQSAQNKVSITSVICNIFALRLLWFLKMPVAQTFCKQNKTDISLWNGKHPLYRMLFFVFTLFLLFFMPYKSFDYGITWDEPEDHKYFIKVYNYLASGGEDKSCLDQNVLINSHLVYYGPIVNLTCVLAHKFISPFGLYETRHIIIALFGFLAMLFTGLLARKLSNWQIGFLALLLIFLTPFFFGSSMNNQKDIPFAAFYIVGLYYIVEFIKQLPKPSSKLILTLIIVIGLTIGIRIAGVLLLAYLAMFTGIYWLIYTKENKFKQSKRLMLRFLRYMIVIALFAYIIGIILWPFALQNPIKNPIIALTRFESFQMVHIWEIFDGDRYYMKDFPWYYLPKFMLITIPVFIMAGITFILIGLKSAIKTYRNQALFILFFASLFPIVYIIYKQSALYSNWRHVYFVYPPLVVMSALGWRWILEAMKPKAVKIVMLSVLMLLLLKPSVWSFKNHPYQYIYFNEFIGGLNGVYGKYETDYWCQSPREAIEWLLENKPEIKNTKTVIATNNEPMAASYYAKKQTDSIKVIWARPQEWNKADWDYAIWTTRTLPVEMMENGYFPPKGTIHTINADGIILAAIVKRENSHLPIAERLIGKKMLDSAMFHLKHAMSYDPLDEASFRNMGLAYLMQGKFDSADVYLQKSCELYKPNPMSLYFLALNEFNQGKHDMAAEYCYKAIDAKINMSVAYSLLGDMAFNAKKYEEAIKNYEKFIEYHGHMPIIYNQIGKAYLGLSNPRRAIKSFEVAIKLDKNYAEAYYNLGYAYSKIGNQTKANQFMQRAKELSGGQ